MIDLFDSSWCFPPAAVHCRWGVVAQGSTCSWHPRDSERICHWCQSEVRLILRFYLWPFAGTFLALSSLSAATPPVHLWTTHRYTTQLKTPKKRVNMENSKLYMNIYLLSLWRNKQKYECMLLSILLYYLNLVINTCMVIKNLAKPTFI